MLAGWERYDLYDVAHISEVGSLLHVFGSCTRPHSCSSAVDYLDGDLYEVVTPPSRLIQLGL